VSAARKRLAQQGRAGGRERKLGYFGWIIDIKNINYWLCTTAIYGRRAGHDALLLCQLALKRPNWIKAVTVQQSNKNIGLRLHRMQQVWNKSAT
jgi:hypothetical protein